MQNNWKALPIHSLFFLFIALVLVSACMRRSKLERVKNPKSSAQAQAVPEDTVEDIFYYAESLKALVPDQEGRVRLKLESSNSTKTVEVMIDSVRTLEVPLDGEDEMFPEAVFKFRNLRFLNVGMRGFKTIPPGISQLEHLEEIDFQHGFLEKLPDDFCQLRNLREAIFLFSDLKELPECIGDLENLEYLNLNYTHITRFPESMKRLKKLKIVTLFQSSDEPHISKSEYKKLKSWLPRCAIGYVIRNGTEQD